MEISVICKEKSFIVKPCQELDLGKNGTGKTKK